MDGGKRFSQRKPYIHSCTYGTGSKIWRKIAKSNSTGGFPRPHSALTRAHKTARSNCTSRVPTHYADRIASYHTQIAVAKYSWHTDMMAASHDASQAGTSHTDGAQNVVHHFRSRWRVNATPVRTRTSPSVRVSIDTRQTLAISCIDFLPLL